jgi:hypothetical protein
MRTLCCRGSSLASSRCSGCCTAVRDQTAVLLQHAQKYTYHSKKEKQVPVAGLEEKRQITAVVASTLSGELLPMQLIFKGQDRNKNQRKAVPKLDSETSRFVKKEGWRMAQTPNHWSNFDSMLDYIHEIIAPFFSRRGEELGVKEPHCVLLIDCWSVHKSADFLQWLGRAYPRFHPVFVPANCTSKGQPADIMLQRPLKAGVVEQYTAWMTKEICRLLEVGTAPEAIQVDTGMVTIKPLLVKWMVASWTKLRSRTELIKLGWEKAGLGAVLDAGKQVEAMRLSLLHQPAAAEGEEAEPEAVVAGDDTASEDEDEEKEA